MFKRWQHPKKEEGTFANVRDQDERARRRIVVLLLVATAFFGWLYVFFGSGLFRVTQIQIEGLTSLDRGEVEAETYHVLDEQGTWLWKWRNIFFVNSAQLGKELERRLYAEHVAVDKSYPNILRLKVQERQSSVIVIANNEFYLIDHEGIGAHRIASEDEAKVLDRIAKPSSSSRTDVPILTIRNNVTFVEGESFVDAEIVQEWLQAFRDLSDAGFGYRNAILDHPTSTKLVLNLFEPYDAYFDLMTPMPPQIQDYYVFEKNKSPDMKIEQYIDARSPGKIYYK